MEMMQNIPTQTDHGTTFMPQPGVGSHSSLPADSSQLEHDLLQFIVDENTASVSRSDLPTRRCGGRCAGEKTAEAESKG